ncbi:MAG TPA: tannase/feruloyl esterase family alpha/beta hydrolase [Sphingomonas sp.]|nr:tannase/feruloyl esterase family alpha/beta hydrolase [Sphingomonas sp.]
MEPLPDGARACRVDIVARPRPASAIRIELWLPARARWSGRYYQMGNGGFAGTIDRPTLVAAAARGDAVAATDTGHHGNGFDASWASGRRDLVLDYAFRSIKVTADTARRLIGGYYARPARWRYVMGCSYGGRQALVAAARWPNDWDGVLAGAPAYDWPGTLTGFARIAKVVEQAGSGTDAVARAIEREGYPGADADPAEWRQWIFQPDPDAPSQRRFAIAAFRHLFGAGPAWTPANFEPARDVPPAWAEAAFAVGDLGAFFRKGGKLLSYFGRADPVLPPASAPAHWRSLAARAGGEAAMSRSYRLFLVPNMAHCQGGAGPTAFGQSLKAPSLRDDAQHDVRRSLERWVEQGLPPRELVATTGPGEQPARTAVMLPYSPTAEPAARPRLSRSSAEPR